VIEEEWRSRKTWRCREQGRRRGNRRAGERWRIRSRDTRM